MVNTVEVWELLAHDNYCVFNKCIARALKNLHAAVLLGELVNEYKYFKSNNLLDEEGMFFSTVENIEQNISLNDYEQRKALQVLKDVGIVETKQKGLPARRFIKLNSSSILKLICASSLSAGEQDLQRLESNNK